jgi:subfamily B ATP-binding cassette protein MsbA
LGIFLSLLFGVFNASFVWGSKALFSRMEPKDKNATTEEVQTSSLGRGAIQSLDDFVDPLLPRKGEALNWTTAVGGLLFLPLLVGLRGLTNFLSGYCMVWSSMYAIRDLRLELHNKMQSLSMDYFQKKEIGQHTVMLNRGMESLQRCMEFGFGEAIKEPFAILAIAAALFIMDWQLALFGLVFVPITIIPITLLGRRIKKLSKKAYDQSSDQDSLLIQVYTNMRTVKAFCLEQLQMKRFAKIYQNLARLGIKHIQAKLVVNPSVEVIGVFGLGLVILFVFYTGKSAPDLVAFLTGGLLIYQPIKKMGTFNALAQEAMVGVERIQAVQNTTVTVTEAPKALRLEAFNESIRLENLTFSYGDELVVKGVEVEVPKGAKLGVVGESGAGKSTLVSLLLRFYDPTKGRITIDGVDIREVSFESLRGHMALVSQEVVIFDQTVEENIACGKLNASREEIVEAAKAANAHEFIENLPEGYDTRLGEQGMRLSGGQRQRIAIARAFVRQAPILILDEATAALDSKAESEVQAAIDRLEEGRTVICVAHRLSTLRGMDRIIVLSAGSVIEEGGFAELLERNGEFAAMARKQGISVTEA